MENVYMYVCQCMYVWYKYVYIYTYVYIYIYRVFYSDGPYYAAKPWDCNLHKLGWDIAGYCGEI